MDYHIIVVYQVRVRSKIPVNHEVGCTGVGNTVGWHVRRTTIWRLRNPVRQEVLYGIRHFFIAIKWTVTQSALSHNENSSWFIESQWNQAVSRMEILQSRRWRLFCTCLESKALYAWSRDQTVQVSFKFLDSCYCKLCIFIYFQFSPKILSRTILKKDNI